MIHRVPRHRVSESPSLLNFCIARRARHRPSLVSKFEYSLSGPCPVDSARVEWKSAMEGWGGGGKGEIKTADG